MEMIKQAINKWMFACLLVIMGGMVIASEQSEYDRLEKKVLENKQLEAVSVNFTQTLQFFLNNQHKYCSGGVCNNG
jgi:hypothetical protein